MFSRRRVLLLIERSVLKIPGPRIRDLPPLPKVPGSGSENTLVSNHCSFVSGVAIGPLTLGRCAPPPTPARSTVRTGVIGRPDCADVIPDICQPSSGVRCHDVNRRANGI